MSVQAVATRYARALLEVASEQNQVDQIGRELERVAQVLGQSRELSAAFAVPTITSSELQAVVRELATLLRLSKTSLHTLLLLAERDRLRIVPALAAAYRSLADAKLGVVSAVVEAPVAIDAVRLRQLETALSQDGIKVRIRQEIDTAILGGVRLRMGGQLYDATLNAQLDRLRETLLSKV